MSEGSSTEEPGAEVEPFDLRELGPPMYEPRRPLEGYCPEVQRFVEVTGGTDTLTVGTAAYCGMLAGVTKNALGFTQYLEGDEKPTWRAGWWV